MYRERLPISFFAGFSPNLVRGNLVSFALSTIFPHHASASVNIICSEPSPQQLHTALSIVIFESPSQLCVLRLDKRNIGLSLLPASILRNKP